MTRKVHLLLWKEKILQKFRLINHWVTDISIEESKNNEKTQDSTYNDNFDDKPLFAKNKQSKFMSNRPKLVSLIDNSVKIKSFKGNSDSRKKFNVHNRNYSGNNHKDELKEMFYSPYSNYDNFSIKKNNKHATQLSEKVS